eukprot:gene20294-23056_t
MGNQQAKRVNANNTLEEQDGSVIVSPLQQEDTGDKFDLESQAVSVLQDAHENDIHKSVEGSGAEDDQGPPGNTEPTLAWGYSLIEDERLSTDRERRGSTANV